PAGEPCTQPPSKRERSYAFDKGCNRAPMRNAFVAAIRDLGRLREITAVLVRHGFGEMVTRLGLVGSRKARQPLGASDQPNELDDAELARGEEEKRQISIYERARRVLQDLGPSFIKLGQIVSTRPDLLPPQLIQEFKKLQDSVPPVPFDEIRKVVES